MDYKDMRIRELEAENTEMKDALAQLGLLYVQKLIEEYGEDYGEDCDPCLECDSNSCPMSDNYDEETPLKEFQREIDRMEMEEKLEHAKEKGKELLETGAATVSDMVDKLANSEAVKDLVNKGKGVFIKIVNPKDEDKH